MNNELSHLLILNNELILINELILVSMKWFFKTLKIRFWWSQFCVFDRLSEKIEIFAWWHLFRLVRRIIFKKNNSKTDLPSNRFSKIGLRDTLFIFGRKNIHLLLQLCPILAYLKKNWSTHRAEKDAFKEKRFDVLLGNCSTHKVPRFCRFIGFTKMQLI